MNLSAIVQYTLWNIDIFVLYALVKEISVVGRKNNSALYLKKRPLLLICVFFLVSFDSATEKTTFWLAGFSSYSAYS